MTLAAVTSGLIIIVMSGRFVKYLAQAASGDIAPQILLSVILFRIPSFLEMILPLAFFLSVMLVYGRMYVESEMVVISACGISKNTILLYTLIPAGFVAALVAALSLYVTPVGIQKVQSMLKDPNNSRGVSTLVAGRFQDMAGNGRVTYIETLNSDRSAMRHVFGTLSTDDEGSVTVFVSDSAKIKSDVDTGQRYFHFYNGATYKGKPGRASLIETRFGEYVQRLKIPDSERQLSKKVDARSTRTLLIESSNENIAAMQWRLSLPLIIPIAAIIALALSETTHRRGRYAKLLPGFLLYLLYVVGLNLARETIETGSLPANIGMWPVHLLFLLIGLLLLNMPALRRALRKRR